MRRLHELYTGPREGGPGAAQSGPGGIPENTFLIPGYRDHRGKKLRINILAMGDVGGTLALAMKLTGGDVVSGIGICDISETALSRWEQELNQISLPGDPHALPRVIPTETRDLFDCDVFVFCASRGVPDLSQKDVDVRMAQLEKNMELVSGYAAQAAGSGYEGEFFVVSDPVDPLCAGAVRGGIPARRVQGFGLGVMNGRAAYFARQAEKAAASDAGQTGEPRRAVSLAMASYLTEGRVFGPHGEDLVVANSVMDYNEEASLRLTRLTTSANLRIRELGFKPYIAPAVTSGALSILENLRGRWQYSSAWFGGDGDGRSAAGAFLGMRNRRAEGGLLVEDLPLDERLYGRIEKAYRNLERIV